jgi:exodeoxyribonuclease-3
MFKIISWNVNGIRSIFNKGFCEFLDYESPSITCLQEIKAQHKDIPKKILENDNFFLYNSSAQKKGYSGVATLTQIKPVKLISEIGIDKFDSEGRTQILEYKNFTLINSYIPNGQRDHKRVPYKLEYCESILKIIKKYQKKKIPVIWCGDFNTAHHPIDLANPKSNINTTGFLPNERAFHDKLLKNNLHDIFREHHPQLKGAYTWWTYRNNCRDKNVGWRIDYFFVTSDLVSQVKSTDILKDVMGSDHCPIKLELN